ncbi:hypothetical protein LEMLEM_LOCUS16256 [Lemmus lemmus]
MDVAGRSHSTVRKKAPVGGEQLEVRGEVAEYRPTASFSFTTWGGTSRGCSPRCLRRRLEKLEEGLKGQYASIPQEMKQRPQEEPSSGDGWR